MRPGSVKQPYATTRAYDVNFGDKTLVRADKRQPLAEISVVEAQAFTCYVTARVEEEDISGVRLGQAVDVSVDAYPNAPVRGTVTQIQASAAGQFTIYPSPDSDPTNPQKIDQYIPVKIAISDSGGARLLPGMNVTVHIRRD